MAKYIAALAAVILLAVVLPKFMAVEPKKTETPDKIIIKMTLEEKVGQVIIGSFTFKGTKVSEKLEQQIKELHLGGVILFGSNIVDIDQVGKLTEELQNKAIACGKAPLFVSIDQEGGLVARLTKEVTMKPELLRRLNIFPDMVIQPLIHM